MDLVVKSEHEIATRLASMERNQLAAAAATMHMMAENAHRQAQAQEEGNRIQSEMAWDISGLLGEAERINFNLERIDERIEELDATVAHGFGATISLLGVAIGVLRENQKTLAAISETLSHRYDTEVKELLAEGVRWLKEGAKSDELKEADSFEARKALDYWDTALKRFNDVVANKVGEQNYVAWFEIGWLRWKLIAMRHTGEPSVLVELFHDAEKAFYTAQLYSAPNRDLLHTKALRHMAEMQYLQGKHGKDPQTKYAEAWQTSQRALTVSREYETIYNAARYAAKLSRRNDVVSCLDECIELRPGTIQIMFSEEDFLE